MTFDHPLRSYSITLLLRVRSGFDHHASHYASHGSIIFDHPASDSPLLRKGLCARAWGAGRSPVGPGGCVDLCHHRHGDRWRSAKTINALNSRFLIAALQRRGGSATFAESPSSTGDQPAFAATANSDGKVAPVPYGDDVSGGAVT